ncbi:hypothetical protein [Rufibacter aurantiacus]|uniref:hypothetical protein n=1 Tax=Rufibacter aurantiacus TaxID=2817374 RepID=UPI001B309AB9|nr:hypothetical protein [Rufibacter aurantiacus]
MKTLLFTLAFSCFISCKTISNHPNAIKTPDAETESVRTANFGNGQLKENGNYNTDTYTTCCIHGFCPIRYHYKTGKWVYFHPNGQVRAKGTYRVGKKHIETSCEDGAEINFGFVTNRWKFYDSKGNEIKPNERLIKEIEESGYFDEFSMPK